MAGAFEIQFIESREQDCYKLIGMLEQGELPIRVTHNDTKINNVMIDKEINEAVAIDLIPSCPD